MHPENYTHPALGDVCENQLVSLNCFVTHLIGQMQGLNLLSAIASEGLLVISFEQDDCSTYPSPGNCYEATGLYDFNNDIGDTFICNSLSLSMPNSNLLKYFLEYHFPFVPPHLINHTLKNNEQNILNSLISNDVDTLNSLFSGLATYQQLNILVDIWNQHTLVIENG